MIPQACGAKYYIKEEFLDETDVDDVVVALVSLARKVSCDSIFSVFLFLMFPILASCEVYYCNFLNAHIRVSVPRNFISRIFFST